MHCFVIAEAGVNHNGSLDLALRLVDAAADAHADAVKFQTFRADRIAGPSAAKAAYQREQTGEGSQFEMLRTLEMSIEMHEMVARRCRERQIEFMSTAFDEDSADYLFELGIKRVKVPSGELTNHPFLRHLAARGLPMIVSTGMSTLDEVRQALDVIQASREENGFLESLDRCVNILHCTSNYPAADEELNLRAIVTLRQAFDIPVGYSDHSSGTLAAPITVALGATVIEKHFTIDRDLPGPDHRASLLPEELARMISDIRRTEKALGHGRKEPTLSELAVRDVVRRSVTLRVDKEKGEILGAVDLVLLRPGTGIPPSELDSVFGRKLKRSLPAGSLLQWTDVESS